MWGPPRPSHSIFNQNLVWWQPNLPNIHTLFIIPKSFQDFTNFGALLGAGKNPQFID